ncbi:MAG: hypothetical protein QME78_02875 [Thermodesulfobacteriota bacterium]|nr:hypothetical protein [Thermodesulfobacteriota bacterium]
MVDEANLTIKKSILFVNNNFVICKRFPYENFPLLPLCGELGTRGKADAQKINFFGDYLMDLPAETEWVEIKEVENNS